jgi:hypothetical protein
MTLLGAFMNFLEDVGFLNNDVQEETDKERRNRIAWEAIWAQVINTTDSAGRRLN